MSHYALLSVKCTCKAVLWKFIEQYAIFIIHCFMFLIPKRMNDFSILD